MRRFGLSIVASALGLTIAGAAAAENDYAGIPITDPSFEPSVQGVGIDPGVQGAFNTPTILFINFDGAVMMGGCGNDSHNNCSQIINGEILPFPGDDARKWAVVQAAREDVVDFGVIVVAERPPDSQPYAMVMVGEPASGGTGSVGGVAPTIDCGNTNPNITSFAFLVDSGSNTIATVVHQEAAHTWGLEHVDDSTDNLFPTAGGTTDPKYQDVCSQVVSDTMLNPSGGFCNQVHTMFCSSGMQNSYQEMLALFGPPVPDNTAPTITIESPADGAVLDYDEDFELSFTLDDDRRPAILETAVAFDETIALEELFLNTTISLPVSGGDPPGGHGLSNGDHTIRVEIVDESGNPASAEVTITIQNGPGPAADDGNGDDDNDGGTGEGEGDESGGTGGADGDDGGCGCRTKSPSAWSWLALLLLAGIRRRT